MLSFSFAALVALVVGQLYRDQHATLMDVYRAMGEHTKCFFHFFFFHFFFFFFLPGCNETACPRFGKNETCRGESVKCSGQSVTHLCVVVLISFFA